MEMSEFCVVSVLVVVFYCSSCSYFLFSMFLICWWLQAPNMCNFFSGLMVPSMWTIEVKRMFMEGVLLGAPSSIADAPNNFPLFQYCPPVKFDGRTSSVTLYEKRSSVRFFVHFYRRSSFVQTLRKKLFHTNKQRLRKHYTYERSASVSMILAELPP